MDKFEQKITFLQFLLRRNRGGGDRDPSCRRRTFFFHPLFLFPTQYPRFARNKNIFYGYGNFNFGNIFRNTFFFSSFLRQMVCPYPYEKVFDYFRTIRPE